MVPQFTCLLVDILLGLRLPLRLVFDGNAHGTSFFSRHLGFLGSGNGLLHRSRGLGVASCASTSCRALLWSLLQLGFLPGEGEHVSSANSTVCFFMEDNQEVFFFSAELLEGVFFTALWLVPQFPTPEFERSQPGAALNWFQHVIEKFCGRETFAVTWCNTCAR